MATKARGDERKGQDDDEGHGSNVRVVQIENAYHEKLRDRLRQAGGPLEPGGTGPHTAEHADARDSAPDGGDGPAPARPVIYNDDGSVYKRPL